MPNNNFKFSGLLAAKALLMAGLSVLQPLQAASEGEGPIPSRQVAPAITPTVMPTSTPLPSVRPEELVAAEARFEARLKDGIARALKKVEDHGAQHSQELEQLKEKISLLGSQQMDARVRIDKLGEDSRFFGSALEASQLKLSDSLKKTEDLRAQIEQKGSKMEGLLDLVNTLKRDINDNSHQIAELKREFESIKKISKAPVEEQGVWEQLTSWRYLPVAALVLGGVAMGMAASNK